MENELILNKFLASFCKDDTYPPFDGPYLNYTYGKEFKTEDILKGWKKTIKLIKDKKAPDKVGIYIHWPFCTSKCSFCFCDSFVPSQKNELSLYADFIIKELGLFSKIFKNIYISSVYFGGGTPTLISKNDFEKILDFIKENFLLNQDTQIYVESSPMTMDYEKLKMMAEKGVNRITIGVQSLDPVVLKKNNRFQTYEDFEKSFDMARKLGIKINVDLIAGLNGQSLRSFLKDLITIIKKKPDMIHIYSFDPRPHTEFSKRGDKLNNEEQRERELMMRGAEKIIQSKNYLSVKIATVDLSDNHTEDRQDTHWRLHSSSVLGVGYNSVSHAYGSFYYQHPPIGDKGPQKINHANLPPFTGVISDIPEEMRKFVITRLTTGFLIKDFEKFFKTDLREIKFIYNPLLVLEKKGKIKITKNRITSNMKNMEEFAVYSKYLYSEKMKKSLMNAHKEDYQFLLKNYGIEKIDEFLKHRLIDLYKSMSFYKIKD